MGDKVRGFYRMRVQVMYLKSFRKSSFDMQVHID